MNAVSRLGPWTPNDTHVLDEHGEIVCLTPYGLEMTRFLVEAQRTLIFCRDVTGESKSLPDLLDRAAVRIEAMDPDRSAGDLSLPGLLHHAAHELRGCLIDADSPATQLRRRIPTAKHASYIPGPHEAPPPWVPFPPSPFGVRRRDPEDVGRIEELERAGREMAGKIDEGRAENGALRHQIIWMDVCVGVTSFIMIVALSMSWVMAHKITTLVR